MGESTAKTTISINAETMGKLQKMKGEIMVSEGKALSWSALIERLLGSAIKKQSK